MYKGLKQKLDMRVFCMNKGLLFAMVQRCAMVLDMLYLVAFMRVYVSLCSSLLYLVCLYFVACFKDVAVVLILRFCSLI